MEKALTIHEAAEATGWSARMLRYVERVGLVAPARSDAGYRLYRAQELQRLRTLRELLDRHELGLSDVALAQRLREDTGLHEALEAWFTAEPSRPAEVAPDDWLGWEQLKLSQPGAGGRAARPRPLRNDPRPLARP